MLCVCSLLLSTKNMEIYIEIFRFLDRNEVEKCQLVQKSWNQIISANLNVLQKSSFNFIEIDFNSIVLRDKRILNYSCFRNIWSLRKNQGYPFEKLEIEFGTNASYFYDNTNLGRRIKLDEDIVLQVFSFFNDMVIESAYSEPRNMENIQRFFSRMFEINKRPAFTKLLVFESVRKLEDVKCLSFGNYY